MILPDPVIQVFWADAHHEPFGDALSRNRVTVEKKSGTFTTGRVRFSMQPYLLDTDTYYVIIVSNFPPLGGNPASWQYDAGDATYPRGHRISTNDGGETWTQHYYDDFIFAEFGDPPLPKPDPPPPIDNLAVLDLTQTITEDGIKVTIPTSVPCHLWCYVSKIEPRKWITSRVTRGLAVPWHVHYSFIEWKRFEQTEPGDTLYHTFNIIPWAFCETFWLTFRGEVDNIQSPSVGPIFKKHRTAPPPAPITLDFYPDPDPEITSVDGGVIHIEALTFMQLRAAAGSLSVDSVGNTWAYFRSSTTPNLWRDLRRVIYLYDTSAIPIGSTIQSATLTISMVAQADHTGNLPSLCVVSSSPASNTQLIPADYATLGLVALSEIKEWAEIVGIVEHTFTLNALGLAAVIPGGITKLGMREAKFDMAGVQPTWGSNHATGFNLCCVEYGGQYRPKLTVTYVEP